jgi:phosphoserine aminotransferase
MQKKINFNAGPAALPAEVLHEASKAVRNYNNTGLSILELPHRGKEFMAIIEESKALVRELCDLDDSHEVLWMQGGGRMQFCMAPMNFLAAGDTAGYIDSGRWSEEALEYAMHYGGVHILSSSKQSNYSHLPAWPSPMPANLAYVHLTTNNTIFGTQWHHIPDTKIPLIADMSSDIFSCKRDYSKYALFYAAVQKNLGAAGNTLVVVRKEQLAKTVRPMPGMLSYKEHAHENSVLNTANVFGIYVSLLMLRWIKERGIEAIEKDNRRKAHLLYEAIDNSAIFTAHVQEKAHRSLMNVCFTANTPEHEKGFLARCEQNNITGVKGHRFVGGFRASLYNAVTLEDVERLVEIM